MINLEPSGAGSIRCDGWLRRAGGKMGGKTVGKRFHHHKIMNLERLDRKSALLPDGVVSLVFLSNLSP
jgi:hypothetical protein